MNDFDSTYLLAELHDIAKNLYTKASVFFYVKRNRVSKQSYWLYRHMHHNSTKLSTMGLHYRQVSLHMYIYGAALTCKIVNIVIYKIHSIHQTS